MVHLNKKYIKFKLKLQSGGDKIIKFTKFNKVLDESRESFTKLLHLNDVNIDDPDYVVKERIIKVQTLLKKLEKIYNNII